MTCRLCLLDAPLRRSHVFPEFLFGSLYGDDHRYLTVPLSKHESVRHEQKGIREELLCGTCEQRIGRYERYASQILFHRPSSYESRSGQILYVADVDYEQFKLFMLSLLWRSSVSSARGFRNVRLGPHEEILRSHLLRGDPGAPNFYPCMVQSLSAHREEFKAMIVPPDPVKLAGVRAYRAAFAGFVWTWLVSSLVNRSGAYAPVIDRSNRLPIVLMDPAVASRWYARLTRLLLEARAHDV
jgi:hypothetical protein